MKKLLIFFCVTICLFMANNTTYAENARWENPTLIYTYVPQNPNSKMMLDAFSYWSRMTKNKIIFKYVKTPEVANINVRFVNNASKIPNLEQNLGATSFKFRKKCSEYKCTNYVFYAGITIVDNPQDRNLQKELLYKVMIHEIGHAIGLIDHSEDPYSIMYHTIGGKNQTLTKSDMAELSRLYKWQ